jgi:hypothetical protein
MRVATTPVWLDDRMSPRSATARRSLTVVALLALAACAGDPAETGVEVIEGELAEQIGLGPLDATCDEPEDPVAGEEFTCTATTEDDRTIDFVAVFEEDDTIFVYPTNVVTGDLMASVEVEAAERLGSEVGATIDPSDIDCADVNTILAPDGTFTCTITDTTTGEVGDLRVTFGDFDRDEGFRQRDYLIVGLAAG